MRSQEITYIHIIRCIACIMVVMLHTLPNYKLFGIDELYRNFIYIFTKSSVPLFFMITGILLLPVKDEIFVFYKKRIPRVLFPLLIWGVIYTIMNYYLGHYENLNTTIIQLFLVPINSGGILWYLYILIGIYLFIPFISEKIFSSREKIRIFIILWLFSSLSLLINNILPTALGVNIWEHKFNLFVNFSGYLGFLFLGTYLHNFSSFKNLKKLTLYYFLFFAIIYYLHFIIKKLSFTFLSIDNIILTILLFLIIKSLQLNITQNKLYTIIKYISKNSFAIYLCHMFIYYNITINLYSYSTSWYIQFIAFAITFILSLIFAILVKKIPFNKYIIG